jgi:putative redox protein
VDTIRVRHVAGRQFTGWNARGHGIVMDAPAEFKGEGTGPRPIELVLYALGGCTAMDVVSVLEKKRLDVRSVDLTVTGVQREDEQPHYYERVTVEYVVTGVGISDAAVARAIELSETKYCSVKGMFGPQVEVTTSFRVVEAAC